MGATSAKRYAVVSCHVERPLDDRVWSRFAELQRRRPGGFPVAALLRPPDAEAGEDEERWLERAATAAARGPLGHHTHWTSPSHARPTGGDPSARVRREAAWLREHEVPVAFFCGGGWYTDAGVAAACAEAGYVDCTPRAQRPGYLGDDDAWAQAAEPVRIALEDGALVPAVPTTHSAGAALRAGLRGRLEGSPVHVYFHDTDLVDRRRRAVITAALVLLGRRCAVSDLSHAADDARAAPVAPWGSVARGQGFTLLSA